MDQATPGSKFKKKPFAKANGLRLNRPVCQPLAGQLNQLAQIGRIPTREFYRAGAVFDCVLPKNRFRLVPSRWPLVPDSHNSMQTSLSATTKGELKHVPTEPKVRLHRSGLVSVFQFLEEDEGAIMCGLHKTTIIVGESGPHFGKTENFPCGCESVVKGDHVIADWVYVLRRGKNWKYVYTCKVFEPVVVGPVVGTQPILGAKFFIPPKTDLPKKAPGPSCSMKSSLPKGAPAKVSYSVAAKKNIKSQNRKTQLPLVAPAVPDVVPQSPIVAETLKQEEEQVRPITSSDIIKGRCWDLRKSQYAAYTVLKNDKNWLAESNAGGALVETAPVCEDSCDNCGRQAVWLFFKKTYRVRWVDDDQDVDEYFRGSEPDRWVRVRRCQYCAGIVTKVGKAPTHLPHRNAFLASPRIKNPDNAWRGEKGWYACRVGNPTEQFDAHGKSRWTELALADADLFSNPITTILVDYMVNTSRLKSMGFYDASVPNKRDMNDVPGNRQRQIKVGGSGECWKQIPILTEEDVDTKRIEMTAVELADRLQNALDEENFMIEELVCQVTVMADGDLHIAETCFAEDGECSLGRKHECHLWRNSVDLISYLREYQESFVGSAVELIDTSLRVNGPEIAKLSAIDQFNNEVNSLPTTDFRMADTTRNIIQKYLGMEFRTRQRKTNYNDHLPMEISRDFIREDLTRRMPHNTDYSRTLHIGCTMREVNAWQSHTGHDFLFNLTECKDVGRMYSDLISLIGRKMSEMTIPSLTSRKGNSTRLSLNDLDEALSLIQVCGRRRFFTSWDQIADSYDCLMFEDCLYDITEEEFANIFDRTQAKVAYGVIFAPDCMVYKDVMPSRMYDYEEYFPEYQDISSLLDQIWPSAVVFGTMLIPVSMRHHFAEFVHNFLRDLALQGWEKFKKTVVGISTSSYPWETLAGTIFDIVKLRPALVQLFSYISDYMERHFKRVSVVWKGSSNGYDHNLFTWSSHLKNRRFKRRGGMFIDSEVTTRVGEMWLIKYSSSNGESPITYSLSVPIEKQVVYLADVEKSFNITTGRLEEMTYFPVNAKDFFMLSNWGSSEPIESLNMNVLCTMVNRVRNGLSVASNVLVEPMNLFDKDVQRFALGSLMDLYRKKDVHVLISGNKEMATFYKTNLQIIAEKLAKFGVIFATGGLAIPFFYIFKYLLEKKPDVEFSKFPEPENIIRIPASRPKKTLSPKAILSDLKICLPHKPLAAKKSCYMCQMMAEGVFSEDGNPLNGQEWYCEKKDVDPVHEIGFKGSEMAGLINKIRDAKVAHQSLGAAKVVELIRKLEHFLESNLAGIDHNCIVEHIRGGPGTGKTEVIKSYITYQKQYGEHCIVSMPFNELTKDYVETSVLGVKGKHTFEADTMWYTFHHQNVTTLIVDECTAMDWDVIRCQAIFCGAKKIVLVGDAEQTHLNPEAGEGTDPTRSANLDWDRIPTHDLIWNYRLDSWRVKFLNWKYGYRMRCKNPEELPIRFMSKDTYLEMSSSRELVVDKESVFSHAAAPVIFGKESVPGDRDSTNLSVRTTQGKTYKGMHAVSCSQLDDAVMKIAGMINVAVSRSRGQTYFVYAESENDPVVAGLKAYLMVDTPEHIEQISHQPWKEKEEVVLKVALTPEENIINNKIIKMKNSRKAVTIDTAQSEQDSTFEEISLKPGVIKLDPVESEVVPDNKHLWTFLKTQFNFCFMDALSQTFGEEEVKNKLHDILTECYMDDHLMDRPKPVYSRFCDFFFLKQTEQSVLRKKWVKIDDKFTPPLSWCMAVATEHFSPPVVYTEEGEVCCVPKAYRTSKEFRRWAVKMEGHHCVFYQPQPKLCRQYGLRADTLLNPLTFVEGKMVLDWEPKDPQPATVDQVIHVSSQSTNLLNEAVETRRITADEARLISGLTPIAQAGDIGGTAARGISTNVVAPVDNRLFPGQVEIVPNTPRTEVWTSSLNPETNALLGHVGSGSVEIVPAVENQVEIVPDEDTERQIEVVPDEELDFELLSADDIYAGVIINNVPSIVPAKIFDMDRAEYRLAYTKCPPISSFVVNSEKVVEKEDFSRKTPLRLGTDAYNLASVIDPSKAWTRSNMINEFGPVRGNTERNHVTLNLPGFCFSRTKNGSVKPLRQREYRSMNPGYGCHFGDSPIESLMASQRVGKIGMKKQLTAEAKAWAEKVAEDFYRNNWVHNWLMDPLEWNKKIQDGVQASRERNYHKRALALQAKDPTGKPILVASNKVIEKVKGEPDIWKRGQLLLQTPPHINRQYISLFRATNKLIKESTKDHYFMDDYEDSAEFRKRMTRAIAALPLGCRFGIFDLKECDSQQGPVTLHIEKTFYKLVLKEFTNMEDYFQMREALPFIMHGIFSGKTNGEKPSGALDTKCGNTIIAGSLTGQAFYGYGPKVEAGKGDDGLKVQVGLSENYENVKKIKAYTNISIITKIGDGGEFIGTVVNRFGMFNDLAKTALKLCSKRSRNIKHFQEQQISVRNYIKEVQDSGVLETVAFSAEASNYTQDYLWACLAFINSVSHIDEEQWMKITDPRKETKFFLNDAEGPVLL